MIIRIPCGADRYAAHQAVERAIRPDENDHSPRNYVWAMRQGYALVQLPFDRPARNPGEEINFMIETVPGKRDVERRKRVPLPKSEWGAWFVKQMQNAGIVVTDVTYEPNSSLIKATGRKPFTIISGVFGGRGVVIDPQKLCHAQQHGIGRSKAFGYGLLLID